VRVATGIQEHARRLHVRPRRRPVQRTGVVAGFAGVRIGAVLEEHSRRAWSSGFGSGMQAGPPAVRRARIAGASQSALTGEDRADSIDVASHTGVEEAGEGVHLTPLDLRF
jgi:hypothetical protein